MIALKSFSGSDRRRERWLRNYKDSHDSESQYKRDRFGHFEYRRALEDRSNAVLPSELLTNFNGIAVKLLDPFYTAEQLQFFRQFLDRWKFADNARFPPNVRRKDLQKRYFSKDGSKIVDQVIFTPRLALYLLLMSEDDVFKDYLQTWRHTQSHISLQIPENLIDADLQPYCSCSCCFGRCARIAQKYKILPPITVHELLEKEREKKVKSLF